MSRVKRCPTCGQTKSTDEFYHNRAQYDGVDNQCKICKCTYYQSYMKTYSQRPKCKARHRLYRRLLRLDCLAGVSQLQCCCAVCGESDLKLLVIHHQQGNGIEHRDKSGHSHLYWLSIVRSNFDRLKYQVLCDSCHRQWHKRQPITN